MPVSRIPPIQCLLTFEAVARLRSASRAAEDLCVTVSAVSHRLRQLESHLGVRLFSRSDFTPTAEGAAYLQQVGIALAALRELPGERAPRGTPRLRVAVTPSFCRQFVMPKLELFRRDWPDIELTLQVSIPLRDVVAEEAELEIRYGAGGYADLEHRLLLRDDVVPACSPAFLDEHGPFDGFASLAECAGTALVRSPLEPWSNWFAHCGLALPEPARGAQFNDLGLAYDAAAGGFGVALVRQRLGAAWFDSGRLLALSSRPLRSPYAHYLCWRPGALERWECAAFADWLQAVLP